MVINCRISILRSWDWLKPNTDDIREAPALTIIDELLSVVQKVHVFDPEAMNHVQKIYGTRIQYGNNEYEVLQKADALLIATEWSLFRSPILSV